VFHNFAVVRHFKICFTRGFRKFLGVCLLSESCWYKTRVQSLAALQGFDHTWGVESELSLQDKSQGLPVCVNEGEQGLAGLEGLLDTSAVNFVGDKVTERLSANSTVTGKSAQSEGGGSRMVVEKVGCADFLATNVRRPLRLNCSWRALPH
jgi:hypothetical protein